MINIGLVNIDVSHPKSFSAILNKENRARYVAVYNDGFRGDDEVEGFIKNAGLKCRAGSVEELVEMSDIGFIQGCNWDKHLDYAMPFINKGKPVFIDKPIVGSYADCERLEALAKGGAVILGSSSIRYCEEVENFLKKPAEERGEIVHVYGTSGVDEFNYGIHIVETIGGLFGTGAESCAFVGRASVDGKAAETFSVLYKSGAMATYTLFHGTWQPFVLTVMTTKSTEFFNVDNSKVYPALLNRICDYMETGENRLASVEELVESVKIMLAGKVSRENGGIVPLNDLAKYAPAYDGGVFEKGYAAVNSANKIYL